MDVHIEARFIPSITHFFHHSGSLLLICVGVMLFLPTQALAVSCEKGFSGVRLVINFKKAEPVYDTRHSLKWIRRKAKERYKRRHPVGLTSSTFSYHLSNRFASRVRSDGRGGCVWLSEVHLDMAHKDTTVYIAREYRPGSCQYQTIYEHEAEHVRILNRQRARFLPVFHSSLTNLLSKLAPSYHKNIKLEQKRIKRRVVRLVTKKVKQLTKALQQAHAVIDSPKNYAKLQSLCQKW